MHIKQIISLFQLWWFIKQTLKDTMATYMWKFGIWIFMGLPSICKLILREPMFFIWRWWEGGMIRSVIEENSFQVTFLYQSKVTGIEHIKRGQKLVLWTCFHVREGIETSNITGLGKGRCNMDQVWGNLEIFHFEARQVSILAIKFANIVLLFRPFVEIGTSQC